MPELADVEVVRQRLEKALGGATILAAQMNDRRILRPQTPRSFARALVGRTVQQVGRLGQWLWLEFDDRTRLFSHLWMTGWWVEHERDEPTQKAERGRINFVRDGGRESSVG